MDEKNKLIPDEMLQEADRFWDNPKNVIRLIDLVLADADRPRIPS